MADKLTRAQGMRTCEDCGEPATRKTSDDVWLCAADYEALCDAAFIEDYDECAARPDAATRLSPPSRGATAREAATTPEQEG